MSNVRDRLATAVRRLIVPILLSGMLWAQGVQNVPQAVRPQDVFAGWQVALSDAADRTLGAAVADKRWMKTPEVASGSAGTVSTVAIDSLVRVRTAVQRVQQLRPTIEPILRQEGVPSELSAIVLVESGGQITALSPKGARGIWQFMPDTARRYGLVVSTGRDERLDITKSTRAAAHYLRHLHQQFGDWQLAFAAYNAGEQAVGQAIGRIGQRNFPVIERALPQETRNYVPAVMAAIRRLQNHDFGTPTRVIYASRTRQLN
jgi:soluble lytic murein transglycosylase-like protein